MDKTTAALRTQNGRVQAAERKLQAQRRQLAELVHEAMDDHNWSWLDVGTALGVTKQAAWARFHR